MKNGDDLKIALINPRVESYSGTMPALGLLYIAALLERNGFNVKVFDISPADDKDIASVISYSPDVIGITILTDYIFRAKYITCYLKKNLPEAFIVIGGVHVTVLPEESLVDFSADVGVISEGEYTMLELCKFLKHNAEWKGIPGIVFKDKGGKIVITAQRKYIDNLDELPLPARHLLDFEEYLIPPGMIRGYWFERATTVMTSRGCPFTCIWCGSQCTFGRKVRYRSIDNVMMELESLIEKYSVDCVWFVDDTFTLKKDRVLEFCDQIQKRKIKLAWGCQAHVKTADLEMFQKMKRSGLVQLDFGVESGSDRVLNYLKKHSDILSIKKAFALAKRAGIRTCATFMFGSPGEEKEDVLATFKLAREIKPNFTSSYFITPYPGTELMKMAVRKGWQLAGDRCNRGLKRRPMLLINFKEQDLFKIRKDFQRLFALRNFSGCILNVNYFLKGVQILIRYPLGLIAGFRAFIKTLVFDDFLFGFLIYYISKRSEKMRALKNENM